MPHTSTSQGAPAPAATTSTGGGGDSALSLLPALTAGGALGFGSAFIGGGLSLLGANRGAQATEDELNRQEALRSGFQQERVAGAQQLSGALGQRGTGQLDNALAFLNARLSPERNQFTPGVQGPFDQNLQQALGGVQFANPLGGPGVNTVAAGQQQNQQDLGPLLALLGQQDVQRQRAGFDVGLGAEQQLANAPLQQQIGDLLGINDLQTALIGLREQEQLGGGEMRLQQAGEQGGGLRLLGSLVPQLGLGIGGALS